MILFLVVDMRLVLYIVRFRKREVNIIYSAAHSG